jgi:hypothetical protein
MIQTLRLGIFCRSHRYLISFYIERLSALKKLKN